MRQVLLLSAVLLASLAPTCGPVTLPVTKILSWSPNAPDQQIVRYTVRLDATTPIIVLPATCRADCAQPLTLATFGAHVVAVVASNYEPVSSTPGLRDSDPAILMFTLNQDGSVTIPSGQGGTAASLQLRSLPGRSHSYPGTGQEFPE